MYTIYVVVVSSQSTNITHTEDPCCRQKLTVLRSGMLTQSSSGRTQPILPPKRAPIFIAQLHSYNLLALIWINWWKKFRCSQRFTRVLIHSLQQVAICLQKYTLRETEWCGGTSEVGVTNNFSYTNLTSTGRPQYTWVNNQKAGGES